MYINKCAKCGKEFETKNPKRLICPACLYADKPTVSDDKGATPNAYPRSYSAGSSDNDNYRRPSQNQNRPYQQRNNNNNNYRRHNNNNNNNNRSSYGGNQNRQQFNRGPRKPMPRKPKQLLLTKEQIMQIEALYKKMLPLPNHDAHEVIGAQLEIEPKKVFFGINLIRQKMMLPKISYPKRKLALTVDQLTAIKSLYEPLLPLPPMGCHKIIAAQLRMDEWRVHVGIGLLRKQMGLQRWNPDREDAPEEFKVKKEDK